MAESLPDFEEGTENVEDGSEVTKSSQILHRVDNLLQSLQGEMSEIERERYRRARLLSPKSPLNNGIEDDGYVPQVIPWDSTIEPKGDPRWPTTAKPAPPPREEFIRETAVLLKARMRPVALIDLRRTFSGVYDKEPLLTGQELESVISRGDLPGLHLVMYDDTKMLWVHEDYHEPGTGEEARSILGSSVQGSGGRTGVGIGHGPSGGKGTEGRSEWGGDRHEPQPFRHDKHPLHCNDLGEPQFHDLSYLHSEEQQHEEGVNDRELQRWRRRSAEGEW
ncbi:unnamed protein product, partial [Discosporangium mesarthrocarpum]